MKLSGRAEGDLITLLLLARSPVLRRSASSLRVVAHRRSGKRPADATTTLARRRSREREKFTAGSRVKESYFHGRMAPRKRPPLGARPFSAETRAIYRRSETRETVEDARPESTSNIEEMTAYVAQATDLRYCGVLRNATQDRSYWSDSTAVNMAELSCAN